MFHFLELFSLYPLLCPSSLKNASSIKESFYSIIFNTCFLLDSIICPPIISSSKIKYAWWKLKIRSSSHTLPKYLSRISTKWWMISKTINSLSSFSTPAAKYKLAYLLVMMRDNVRIPFKHNFVITPLQEVGQPAWSSYNHAADLYQFGVILKTLSIILNGSIVVCQFITSFYIDYLSFWLKGL